MKQEFLPDIAGRSLKQIQFVTDQVRLATCAIKLTANPTRTELIFDMFAIADRHRERFQATIDRIESRNFENKNLVQMFEQKFDPAMPELDDLIDLGEDTFGGAFARFMAKHNLQPGFYPEVQDPFGDRLRFLDARLRKIHDTWHVVVGFPPSVIGEIGLQAFTLAQVGAPATTILIVGGLIHTLFKNPEDIELAFASINAGWAIGKSAQSLIAFPFEDHWSTDLQQLRKQLGVPENGAWIEIQGEKHG